jgi:hypothetical protein
VLQKIDGKLVVMGNVPTTGTELGKSLSSANFQALGPKPAPALPAAAAQAPASPAPSPASTGAPAKP